MVLVLAASTETPALRTGSSRNFDNHNGIFTVAIATDSICRPDRSVEREPLQTYGQAKSPALQSGNIAHWYCQGEEGWWRELGNLKYGYNWDFDCPGVPPLFLTWHGFAHFDLGMIPDTAIITTASFHYRQYHTDPPYSVTTTICQVPSIHLSARTLFAIIGTTKAITDTLVSQDGWNTRQFNTKGLRAIDSCRSQGWIALALKYCRGYPDSAHGCTAPESLRPYLLLHYLLLYPDVGVWGILAPTDTVDSGAVVMPKAVVENFSNLELVFPVRLSIGGAYVSDTIITLTSGEADTVSFAPWTATQTGTFEVKCTTMLESDEDPSNDCVTDTVVVRTVGAIGEDLGRTAESRFSVAPNPTTGRSVISYSFPMFAPATVAAHDVTGREVWHTQVSQHTGAVQLPLLSAGVYLVRLEFDTFTATEKLVVQR